MKLVAIGDGREPVASILEQVVLGSFVCDFGNIIKGTHKTRSFKVTNTGSLPITFGIRFVLLFFYISLKWEELEKRTIQATGCVIDPEKIKRLPSGESVIFTAIYQASPSISIDTKVEIPIPFSIKGGPTYLILFYELQNRDFLKIKIQCTSEGQRAST